MIKKQVLLKTLCFCFLLLLGSRLLLATFTQTTNQLQKTQQQTELKQLQQPKHPILEFQTQPNGQVLWPNPIAEFSGQNFDVLPVETRFEVKMLYVIDGDTAIFDINNHKIKCRFLGIDTPELATQTTNNQPFSLAAKVATEAFFVESNQVFLELDGPPFLDKYNRLLVYVFNDSQQLLQLDLLADGLARFATYGNSQLNYRETMAAQERLAQEQKQHIWSLADYVFDYGFHEVD